MWSITINRSFYRVIQFIFLFVKNILLNIKWTSYFDEVQVFSNDKFFVHSNSWFSMKQMSLLVHIYCINISIPFTFLKSTQTYVFMSFPLYIPRSAILRSFSRILLVYASFKLSFIRCRWSHILHLKLELSLKPIYHSLCTFQTKFFLKLRCV